MNLTGIQSRKRKAKYKVFQQQELVLYSSELDALYTVSFPFHRLSQNGKRSGHCSLLLFKTAQVCDPNGTGCLEMLQLTFPSNNTNPLAAAFIRGIWWRERHRRNLNIISLIQTLPFVLQFQSVTFTQTLQCMPGASSKTKRTQVSRLFSPRSDGLYRIMQTAPRSERLPCVTKRNMQRNRLMIRFQNADINFRKDLSKILSLLCDSLRQNKTD